MGESNTIVSAYTLYRHLQQYCSHPSICCLCLYCKHVLCIKNRRNKEYHHHHANVEESEILLPGKEFICSVVIELGIEVRFIKMKHCLLISGDVLKGTLSCRKNRKDPRSLIITLKMGDIHLTYYME